MQFRVQFSPVRDIAETSRPAESAARAQTERYDATSAIQLGLNDRFSPRHVQSHTMPDGFSGFPPELLQFLSDLARNNDRDWFAQNRDRYDDHLVGP
ncbi:MAG: DUF2461 family protein, partial [Maioricimonas sp. JB045]